MAEIKFRAWHKKENKMYYVDYKVGVFETNSKWWAISQNDETVVDCTNGILMQYTGLKDKNGKEIYEGDIILHNINLKSEVIYSENDAAFRLKHKKMGLMYLDKNFSSKHNEIIGNIYENSKKG